METSTFFENSCPPGGRPQLKTNSFISSKSQSDTAVKMLNSEGGEEIWGEQYDVVGRHRWRPGPSLELSCSKSTDFGPTIASKKSPDEGIAAYSGPGNSSSDSLK